MTDLNALWADVKAATGPDRSLDLALARALVPDVVVLRQRDDDSGFDAYTHWHYTEKIDDALALVERVLPGYGNVLHNHPGAMKRCVILGSIFRGPCGEAHHRTLPLAIVAAMLRILVDHQ